MINHAIKVSFITTSNSYKNFGQNIKFDIFLDKVEVALMQKNYSSNIPINTFGQIKNKGICYKQLND